MFGNPLRKLFGANASAPESKDININPEVSAAVSATGRPIDLEVETSELSGSVSKKVEESVKIKFEKIIIGETIENGERKEYGYGTILANLKEVVEDLKYATGKQDKLDLAQRKIDLENLQKMNSEYLAIEAENKRNFEPGMSFTKEQSAFLETLNNSLIHKTNVYGKGLGDIDLKYDAEKVFTNYKKKQMSGGYVSADSRFEPYFSDYEKLFGTIEI